MEFKMINQHKSQSETDHFDTDQHLLCKGTNLQIKKLFRSHQSHQSPQKPQSFRRPLRSRDHQRTQNQTGPQTLQSPGGVQLKSQNLQSQCLQRLQRLRIPPQTLRDLQIPRNPQISRCPQMPRTLQTPRSSAAPRRLRRLGQCHLNPQRSQRPVDLLNLQTQRPQKLQRPQTLGNPQNPRRHEGCQWASDAAPPLVRDKIRY